MGAPGRRGCGGGPISSSMALVGPQLSWASPDSPVETEGQRDKARKLLGRAPQGVLGKRGEAGGGPRPHLGKLQQAPGVSAGGLWESAQMTDHGYSLRTFWLPLEGCHCHV